MISACVLPLRNLPDFVRNSALACRKHIDRFLQCFLFFLRGFFVGKSKPCIVNCPLLRIASRPEGRREEILPPDVTITLGLLTISRKSSTVNRFAAASSRALAASSMRRRSSCRTCSSKSRSRRISSRISRSSWRVSGRSNSPLSSRSMKSSRSKENSTKGITLKPIELRSEQVQHKCLQMLVRGIHTSFRSY